MSKYYCFFENENIDYKNFVITELIESASSARKGKEFAMMLPTYSQGDYRDQI